MRKVYVSSHGWMAALDGLTPILEQQLTSKKTGTNTSHSPLKCKA
jgi:hypothetical protein